MPITRTPWVDDDGTGTTGTIINNAEKQTLYSQIDEALATLNVVNTFEISDASGAGLGRLGSGMYVKVGRAVFIVTSFLYPATADGNMNVIGGLPFVSTVAFYCGFYLGYGPKDVRVWTQPASTNFQLLDGVTGQQLPNSLLSNVPGHITGVYFVD